MAEIHFAAQLGALARQLLDELNHNERMEGCTIREIVAKMQAVLSIGYDPQSEPDAAFDMLRKLVRRQAIIPSQIQFVEKWLVANDPGYTKPRQG